MFVRPLSRLLTVFLGVRLFPSQDLLAAYTHYALRVFVRLVNPRVTERRAEVPPAGVNFNAPAYRSPVGPKSPG
jgi:hypothetical protein